MPIELVDEDYIREQIESFLDYAICDEGIGNYEFGDGNYTDVDMQMRIVENTLEVSYSAEPDSVIFTEVRGILSGYDSNENEFECAYVAELLTVDWNHEMRVFETQYGIRED
tara:strand:- start:142 stop:477 length:336 start_codon:yes stop_codon:yes gene_type:complete